jgi:hypothetical protein
MTVVFEFAFGHWVDGDSWSALLENYDVRAGKVWSLVPTAMAVGPAGSGSVVNRSPRSGSSRMHTRGATCSLEV